jgi:hypothetical protein
MINDDDFDLEQYENFKQRKNKKRYDKTPKNEDVPCNFQDWDIHQTGKVYWGIRKGERVVTGFLSVASAKDYISTSTPTGYRAGRVVRTNQKKKPRKKPYQWEGYDKDE